VGHLADIQEIKRTIYKPSDKVPASGIYKVIHDVVHHDEHEVTCVFGEPFPRCCGSHPRFQLVRNAHHIRNHEHFKKK
jgi:hypothetical protein